MNIFLVITIRNKGQCLVQISLGVGVYDLFGSVPHTGNQFLVGGGLQCDSRETAYHGQKESERLNETHREVMHIQYIHVYNVCNKVRAHSITRRRKYTIICPVSI